MQSFGLYTALGIGFCWFWSLIAIPAFLAWLGPDRMRPPAWERDRRGRSVEKRVERFVRRPGRTALIALGVTVVLGVGSIRLEIQDRWLSGLSPSSPLRQARLRRKTT